MRQAIFLLAPLLAACGGGGGNETAQTGRSDSRGDSRPPVQTESLTGLYEARGEGRQGSAICMIAREPGTASFGLVIATAGGSCSGSGEASRTGERLRLTMAGEGECAIDARIEETEVSFPAAVPGGCAYYCGPGASLAGERFEKTGGTNAEAMRATDLAGDPLCG